MQVELYGIARSRAGVARVDVPPGNLAAILEGLAGTCPGLVPEVLDARGRLSRHFVVCINGRQFPAPSTALDLAESDTLLLLGAEAGG